MLIQSFWLSHRDRPLTVFLPEELSRPLLQWLSAIYLGPDFLPFEMIFIAWEAEEPFEVCGLQIRPRETTHLRSLTEKFGNGRFKSYSLQVEHSEFRIVFSGDLGSPMDLEVQLGNPVDLWSANSRIFRRTSSFGFSLRGKSESFCSRIWRQSFAAAKNRSCREPETICLRRSSWLPMMGCE